MAKANRPSDGRFEVQSHHLASPLTNEGSLACFTSRNVHRDPVRTVYQFDFDILRELAPANFAAESAPRSIRLRVPCHREGDGAAGRTASPTPRLSTLMLSKPGGGGTARSSGTRRTFHSSESETCGCPRDVPRGREQDRLLLVGIERARRHARRGGASAERPRTTSETPCGGGLSARRRSHPCRSYRRPPRARSRPARVQLRRSVTRLQTQQAHGARLLEIGT